MNLDETASRGRDQTFRFTVVAGCILLAVIAVGNEAVVLAADLLDEVIAGSNANLEKIQHGHAVYSIEFKRPNHKPITNQIEEYDVQFNFPKTRVDSKNRQDRRIYLEDRTIEFSAGNLPVLERVGARNFSAIISVPRNANPMFAHPRMMGPEGVQWPGRLLGAMRANGKWTLAVERADEELVVKAVSKELQATEELRVSPKFGYGVVAAKKWAPAASDEEPFFVMTAEFEATDNGAFVVSHRFISQKIAEKGKLVPYSTEEVRLKEISLKTVPDDSVFTLGGMGLPIGARIQDRIKNTEHLFGADEKPEKISDDGQK